MKMSMRFILRQTLPALAAAVAICGSAQGAVLYQQAPLDGGASFLASVSGADHSGIQNADSFTLGGASTVTGIRWWGTEPVGTGAFVVRLLPDPLGLSDGDMLSGMVAETTTGLFDAANNPIVQYELTLFSSIAVPATTSRYVSVLFDSTDDWAWIEGTGADDESAFRGQDGTPWDMLPPDLAFAILGERQQPPIPEPGILALLAAGGLAGFSLRRASKRRAFAAD